MSRSSQAESSLASATLAQLYLRQGHPARARATLSRRLQEEPQDHRARALARILDQRAERRASLVLLGHELQWRLPPEFQRFAPELHLCFQLHGELRAGQGAMTSLRIPAGRAGGGRVPFPPGLLREGQSAVIALVHSRPGHPIRILATASKLC